MRVVAFVLCILFIGLAYFEGAWAQVMTSGSYQIQSDSINFGGGRSTSTSFIQESTFGEVATGLSTSSTYSLRAGYQQMQQVYLSLTGGDNVTMDPTIPGVSGGIANGSTSLNALTDSPSGYQLTVEFSGTPAMESSDGDTIADYTPAGANADYNFTTDSTDAHFGFSPFGPDIIDRYKDTGGSACGSGTSVAQQCWDSPSTTAVTVAQNTAANHPTGATTTLYFRVGVGSAVVQPSGTYIATTTVTLLAL